jgi:hypothetical protein
MSIQWGRILLAAFLMELVLIAIAVPVTLERRQLAAGFYRPAPVVPRHVRW